MRFEPNVNVAILLEGKEFRTPISEIKNLNSFRAVREAIAYESQRQVAAWPSMTPATSSVSSRRMSRSPLSSSWTI